MRNATDPLRIEFADGPHGIQIARQPPPPGAVSFSATYIGPAGWAYEPGREAGIARVTAQLITSGAGRRNRVELARFLDRLGGSLAAHCDPESAEVTVWGPTSSAPALLSVLADAVLRPRFESLDLERVRRQMLERQLRELAQPSSRADRELHRAVFPSQHPYRTAGLGNRQTVSRLRTSDLRKFHRRHFTGSGGLLVATTHWSTSSLGRSVRRSFEDLPDSMPPRPSFPRPQGGKAREVVIDLPEHAQVEVRMGGPSVARGDPSYPGAYLADAVLGGATLLSRLFTRVRSKGGLAYHASSHLESMRWGGYWTAEAGSGTDRWHRVVPMLRDEVERIASEPIPTAELDRVRESRLGEIALALESTADAHELALDVAYHGLAGDHWVTWPAHLRGIGPAEVRRAAEIAFERHGSVTVVVGPVRKG